MHPSLAGIDSAQSIMLAVKKHPLGKFTQCIWGRAKNWINTLQHSKIHLLGDKNSIKLQSLTCFFFFFFGKVAELYNHLIHDIFACHDVLTISRISIHIMFETAQLLRVCQIRKRINIQPQNLMCGEVWINEIKFGVCALDSCCLD